MFITNANRVERFYFDCQALHPDVMRRELLIGLEQVWEGNLGRAGGLKDGVGDTVCTPQFSIPNFCIQRVESVASMPVSKLRKEKEM